MLESILIILLIFIILLFKYLYDREITFVESNQYIKKKYLVRNLIDKNKAANLLANIEFRIRKLVNFILNEKPGKFYNNVLNIKYKLKNCIIKESSGYSSYTSYSINKGDQLVFCLRSKKDNSFHDINELMYVAIHEIAHIACPEIGHTDLFFEINRYLLSKASEYNLYKIINYKKNNKEYCGLTLTNNILT